jgi:hypothetical protein
VARLVRLTRGYFRNAQRLTHSPETRRKVIAEADVLAAAPSLPGPDDMPGLIPPGLAAFVRRVPGLALWLWYTATADTLMVHALTDAPP